jgi:O-succinylbenzoic acid--CoA ligase
VRPPEDLREGDLVAAAEPPGPDWITLIHDAWERGAAVLPLDARLPEPERGDLVRRARPTLLLDGRTWTRIGDGVPAEGLALVVHTSGTAGVPKLVEFERSAIDAAVAASSLALGATNRDRWLCCLPVAHVGGLLVILRAVLLGAPVVVHERFDATAVASAEADFVSVVPKMLRRLLDARVDVAAFRAMLVGGAALRDDVRARAAAAGATVVETYGLTETCGGVVYDGRPLPGTEVRIADGGIELRGPTSMRGYRLDPARTAAAFTADGWLTPGDAGTIYPDGTLRVFGRVDDLINTGGEKVWPQEVESALATHPGVADIAVTGAPDPDWGQRVVAFVAPADPDDPPTLQELRDHASSTIARFKAPHELVLVRSLARTASGKIRRADLSRARRE